MQDLSTSVTAPTLPIGVEDDCGWTFLGVVPLREVEDEHVQLTTPIAVNATEFIVSTTCESNSENSVPHCRYCGVVKHNVATNTWNNTVTRDMSWRVGRRNKILPLSHLMAYNQVNNEIYLFGGTGASRRADILCLFAVDLSTNEHRICYTFCPPSYGGGGTSDAKSIVVAGDYVHFIVYTDTSSPLGYQHLAWNWVEQSDRVQILCKWDLTEYNTNNVVVHLKQQNKILMLGGYESHAIYEFDLNQMLQLKRAQLDESSAGQLGAKKASKRWKKRPDISLPFRWHDFCHVITRDEKFLILMYGKNECNEWVNKMYVLNLVSMKWSEANTKMCPALLQFGDFVRYQSPLVVLTGQLDVDLIVSGFIRKMRSLYIPTDIVSIIVAMSTGTAIDILQYLTYGKRASSVEWDSAKHSLECHHFRINIDSVLADVENAV